MAEKRRYIEGFLKKADKAIDTAMQQGVRRADDILDEAVERGKITAAEAQKKSAALRRRAGSEGKRIKSEGKKRLGEGISAAKKLGTSSTEVLETLAKLGELRDAGVITDSEFQAKKKKLLAQI